MLYLHFVDPSRFVQYALVDIQQRPRVQLESGATRQLEPSSRIVDPGASVIVEPRSSCVLELAVPSKLVAARFILDSTCVIYCEPHGIFKLSRFVFLELTLSPELLVSPPFVFDTPCIVHCEPHDLVELSRLIVV